MKWLFLYIAVFFGSSLFSQSKLNLVLEPSDSLHIPRRNAVVITQTSLAALALIGLNQLWYADYPRTSFKTFDDSQDWLQMDKMGHVFSSYQLGSFGAKTLNWAGVSEKDQLLYGATLGLGFLTAIEIMDGFSEEWGFSWSDMAANAAGTGLYIGQELLWQEQRMLLKYSFHRTNFAQQRPDVLGNDLFEEFVKDYNGQTYWLSVNMKSFLKTESLPNWLNLAFGYGAEGMLSGNPNDLNYLNQKRSRQYYLSLDIDLSRIKTNSQVLKTIFDLFNVIKIPFPTLQVDNSGRIKWYYIYF